MTPAEYHEQWSRPKTRSHDYGSSTRSGCPGSVHAVASALLTGSQGLPAALTWHHLPFLISFLLRGQILKDDSVKVLHSICQQISKTRTLFNEDCTTQEYHASPVRDKRTELRNQVLLLEN